MHIAAAGPESSSHSTLPSRRRHHKAHLCLCSRSFLAQKGKHNVYDLIFASSAVTSLWLPTCSTCASPEEAERVCRQTGTWDHSARERSSNKKTDSRHFVPLQLLNAKYRKSLEQRAELGMWHCQGSAVIMGYGARLLLALRSLAFFSAQQLCFKGGAREPPFPATPRLHS